MSDLSLTKKDTTALWHAVDSFAWQVRAMRSPEMKFSPEQIAAEQAKLTAARRALRKVQDLRVAQKGSA